MIFKRKEHKKLKNPKNLTVNQRKELIRLGLDPKDYKMIAAPTEKFILYNINTELVEEVERIK